MKKLLITSSIVVTCLGLSATGMANPTTFQTESQPFGLLNASTTAVKSDDDSDFFLENWLRWLFANLFGWDWGKSKKTYIPGNDGPGYDSVDGGSGYDPGDGGSGYDPGDSGSGYDPGDSGSGYDPGDGGSGYDPGDGGSGYDPGDSGWDNSTDPVQAIPAPGALILSAVGSGVVCWMRRRRIL